MAYELRISWFSVIVIALIVTLVALIGSYFSNQNRDWYEQLKKPPFQPPNWVFPIVWNVIFLLAIVSLSLVWNSRPHTNGTFWVISLAFLNGVLNIAWSALFFGNRMVYLAIWDAAAICLSVIGIIIISWRISRIASILFIPYALWTGFATYLTWVIWRLNV